MEKETNCRNKFCVQLLMIEMDLSHAIAQRTRNERAVELARKKKRKRDKMVNYFSVLLCI